MYRELPTGYLQAYHKYHGDSTGVKTLWAQLKLCREADASLAQLQLGDSAHYQKVVGMLTWKVAELKERIFKAALTNDRAFLAALTEAADMPALPSPEMDAYLAALQAFHDLFIRKGLVSRKDWPKKKEVLARAKQILKKGGFGDVSPRTWTRIFQMPGLSELERAPRRPKNM